MGGRHNKAIDEGSHLPAINGLARASFILREGLVNEGESDLIHDTKNHDVVGIGQVRHHGLPRRSVEPPEAPVRTQTGERQLRAFAAITKRHGEMGSPCHTPQKDWKNPFDSPLMQTENQQLLLSLHMMLITHSSKPNYLNTQIRNCQSSLS